MTTLSLKANYKAKKLPGNFSISINILFLLSIANSNKNISSFSSFKQSLPENRIKSSYMLQKVTLFEKCIKFGNFNLHLSNRNCLWGYTGTCVRGEGVDTPLEELY